MKAVWWNILLISQITCHHLASADRTRISKETTCLNFNGKLGICVPPQICNGHEINGISNVINLREHSCKELKGNPMVCCSNIKQIKKPVSSNRESQSLRTSVSARDSRLPESMRSRVQLLSSTYSFEPVSFASAASLGDKLYSKPMSTQSPSPLSVSRTTPETFASAASIADKLSTKSVLSHSRITSSTSSPQSVFIAANRNFYRHKRANNSTKSFSSTSPPLSLNNSTSLGSLTSSNETAETSIVSLNGTTTTTSKPKVKENDYASEFPKPPVCGVSQGVFSRVVGGNDASKGAFPWITLIAYGDANGFYFKCGGSMITTQHTLTAAHCIYGLEDTIYFVRLGELDLRNHSQTKPIDALVKTKIAHEKYNTTDLSNDIGILVFYRKLIITDFIRPICLPLTKELQSNNFENYRPFVAGWGRTGYEGPAATRLQMLQVPVVSQERCRVTYAPLEFINIDHRVLCAGGTVGKDACHGDSGGPLMQPIWDPTNYTTYFYQIGVVSLGMKCGSLGWPAVYTRVTEYMPWIQKHVLGTDSA